MAQRLVAKAKVQKEKCWTCENCVYIRQVFFSERKKIFVSANHGTLGLSSTCILDTCCSWKFLISYILRNSAECCLNLCQSGPSRKHWPVTRGTPVCCMTFWSSSKVRDPGPGPRGSSSSSVEIFSIFIHVVSSTLTGFLFLLQPM